SLEIGENGAELSAVRFVFSGTAGSSHASTFTIAPGFRTLIPNASPTLSVLRPERVTVPIVSAAISLPRNAHWNGFDGSGVGTAVVLKLVSLNPGFPNVPPWLNGKTASGV